MATSDSIDLSLTASQVIQFSLRKINLLADAETASSEMQARALRALEVMLKGWMRYAGIWRLKEGYATPVADQQGYSLDPRPYWVIDVRWRDADGNDIPMTEMTRQEYYDLPLKSTNGVPTQWYFDPQRSTSDLYIWPLPSSITTETLRITYQRRIEDIDDTDNEIDVDQEHLETVGYNLAARLADDYGRRGPHIDRVIARAQQLFEEMEDLDRPEVIRFIPETRYG